jgi:hypothetical protein
MKIFKNWIFKNGYRRFRKQVFTSPSSNFDFFKNYKCIALEIHDGLTAESDIYKVNDLILNCLIKGN